MSSSGSISREDSAIPKHFVHQRALNRTPSLSVLGADHDQVDRNAHCPEGFPESHELVCAAAEPWLDHEKIEI